MCLAGGGGRGNGALYKLVSGTVIPNVLRDPEPQGMTYVALDPGVRRDDERCVPMWSKTTLPLVQIVAVGRVQVGVQFIHDRLAGRDLQRGDVGIGNA